MNVEPATYTAPAGVDIERLEETLLEEDVGVPHNRDRGTSAGQRVAKRMEGRLDGERAGRSRRARSRLVGGWIDRLADANGLTGALVRLGDLHLVRVPS